MLSKGQKISDRYTIIKSIGEGGMANVFLAEDSILNRKVAVKVLRGDLSTDEKFIRRFQREALSVSNLSHQNIVEVYDVGEEDGEYYIVMEYLSGKTLKQLLKKRETLTLTEVIDIMSQITDGISHAHSSYIIHRDIKPQNIMIEDNGLIKITDFGIAMALNATQLTQTNSVMGSVHYLPPEQASGKNSTIKSDIYSIGILMYELITGNVPFKGDNAVEIALKHMKEKIPSIRKQNPAIPQSVENILLRATAKNPRNRYESAKQMHEDLLHCLDEEHANDKKISFEYPENDLDETAPIKVVKPKVETPSEKEIEKIKEEIIEEKKESKNQKDAVTKDINEDEFSDEEFDEEDFDDDDNEDEDDDFVEPPRKNTIIYILASFFLLLLISAGVIWLVTTKEVEDVSVPDIVGMPIEEAIDTLTKEGFTYTTEQKNSDTIEEGKVVKTNPRAGSTRKKGDTITIYESIGGNYYYLENYVGKDYAEVKAKLELLEINVIVEKKDVEEQEKYKDKEDIILEQEPAYNKDKKTLIEKGDTITIFIPNIVDEYPDMVSEGWTLSSVLAFADEYKINLEILDKNGNTIPESEYSVHKDAVVTKQSLPAGYAILEGVTFKININITYKTPEEEEENKVEETE
ncbi:MAG: Stk1 family PASTA domain-containing Ser/Thr kinase [Bacilli bacterium]|nr:Stk1 family PASTA domain-containing Ser/Thr kinase [Bacilli bacterium]